VAHHLLSTTAMDNHVPSDGVNQRASRLAFVLLFLNIVIILAGACAMAWQSSYSALHPPVPTNLAWHLPAPDHQPPPTD
jgi:hypothetical protein